MKLLRLLPWLIPFAPAAVCLLLAWSLRGASAEFEATATRTPVTVVAFHEMTRVAGTQLENVTLAEVRRTDGTSERVEVGAPSMLAVGQSLELLSDPYEQRRELRGAFGARSGFVVFITLFGAMWLALAVVVDVLAVIVRARRRAG